MKTFSSQYGKNKLVLRGKLNNLIYNSLLKKGSAVRKHLRLLDVRAPNGNGMDPIRRFFQIPTLKGFPILFSMPSIDLSYQLESKAPKGTFPSRVHCQRGQILF